MDDHMLDRLKSDIDLAIEIVMLEHECKTYEEIRDNVPKALEAIKAMINAYNKISQYYYKSEYASHCKTKEWINDYIEERKDMHKYRYR